MILVRLLAGLFGLLVLYSTLFHVLMAAEGREYTWFTGFYWTLTVMSTLGFGDITFHNDLGRMFSMVVLSTGMIFLLVLLPFTFIEFFYAPWMEAQKAAATPRSLPEETHGHVVLTHWDNVTANLIKKLPSYGYGYALIVPTVEEAQKLSRPAASAPVVIVGGGRVGRAAGRSLAARALDYRIIEGLAERIRVPAHYVHGDALQREVLEAGGIADAPAAILTTHDDDTNVYLAIFIRRIRPDIQLIGRANLERNISTLHRAGADFVMSYASMGASAILNTLRGGSLLMVAEGLGLLKVALPGALEGLSLAESDVRKETGCSIVGLRRGEKTVVNPQADTVFQPGDELVVIGNVEAEQAFLKKYPPQQASRVEC